jgi:nitroimidazol reductase NimA-like FMN-containing flavoprotein (pyridoxamine 5'-phosphate oxidase superfamily)
LVLAAVNPTMSETHNAPIAEVDRPYSAPDAVATEWERAQSVLAEAEIYWFSTVRTDGRPHVTPVIAVWADGAVHVTTGPDEQKAKNLAANQNVVVTTGKNVWSGLDVVVEGEAVRVTDDGALRELAAAWEAKYGEEWHFDVEGGAFHHEGGEAHVFAVAPRKAYAYDRDEPGGATRYRF